MKFERGDRRRLSNGKSATGYKDFANRMPAFDKGLLKQCESYHFINFPEEWGAKELFYFMRKTVKAGRLWDIFIPNKRDRRGNRYGFARFLDVRHGQEMRKQLESIWIGNRKVIFNPVVEKGEEKRRWQAKSAEEVRRKSSKKRTSYDESTTVDEENRIAPKKTYAQSLIQQKEKAITSNIDLKGPTPSEARNYMRNSSRATTKAMVPGGFKYKKVIEIKGTEENEENLMKCAVGVALSPSITSNLPEIFFNEGFPSIKITPMGEFLLKVKNNSYNITLVEENWRSDPWWLNKIDNSSVDSEVSSTAFNFGDDSGELDGNFSNGQEEEEIQTPCRHVNSINYPDKLCVSKTFLEESKEIEDFLSNHIQGKQREERANGSHTSFSRIPSPDEGVVQETAQSKSPLASKSKAHSAKGESEPDVQGRCGLKTPKSPIKSFKITEEKKAEIPKPVTGTTSGRRRALLQLVSMGGSSVKRKEVRSLIRKEEIDLACFQETKMERIDKEFCMSIWGRDNFDWVYKASVGRSGGLLCVWDNEAFVKKSVVEIPGALAIYGFWGEKKKKCCIVNVYASCNRNERLETWTELLKLIEEGENCWCIAGDFNSVRSADERRGRSEHSNYGEDLNEFIEIAGLVDLPLTRRKFTWYRSDGSAKSRLDRFLLSDGMINFWGDCCQIGLNRTTSDHCPVMLKKVNSNWGPKPFRTLNCWDQHPEFVKMVEENWNSAGVEGWKGYVCKEKLKRLRNKLKKWNSEVFGSFEKQIAEAATKINEVDNKNEDGELTEEDIMLRKEGFSELWEAWKRREVAWKQKTKLDWVKQGDANSKLFHRIMNSNRRRKMIRGIYKDGAWIEEPSVVKQEVREYFNKIFQEEQWDRPKLGGLQFKQLNEEDSVWLEREVPAKEVKQAVWDCGGDKSPGPDGFSFHIIKSIWNVIEKDIVAFVQEFFRNDKLVRGINSSFIVLIPKKDNPIDLKDYRPISLIGSLYKIISKVLANRIKKVLPKLISGTQSAFLGGRQITDGILILNEVVEEIKRKKISSFIFKADFEKAYDSLNWDFLDEMMRRLGFGEKWRLWIKECLQTASVSVLVNGSPTEEFKMEKGLRQGDPIAPFLFLIVAKGLNVLIESAVNKELFQGIPVGSGDLNISHLQFADDTVIMGKAEPSNIKAVKGILRWFELISGLKINFNKSVLYSCCVSDEWRRMTAANLNCKSGKFPFTYLGMPIGDSMCRRKPWIPVIDNFNKKLAVWKAKSLSIGGRLTLLRGQIYENGFASTPQCLTLVNGQSRSNTG
ncbi:hypothetical protein SLEP1_g38860 [Rubroshorea leprosula]|uniref:Reverse transcriptase domain-containing protein n=1 Tax=Rubroshorea leprosula TaxID=152421 RepID=A0AAV5KYQ8_9ROSI|nr:hypothetical protein SLEP1_g38860 [Rubroshorea leprosula]